MVTIRTKKIATATTPTPHYPITNVVSIVRGLGPSSTKLGMALAKVHCLSCFQQFSIPFHSATPIAHNHMSQHMTLYPVLEETRSIKQLPPE